jgi:mannose-1-phosphate guanylyltransferase
VGSWPSYGQTLTPDAHGNRLGGALSAGKALTVQSRENLIVSSDPKHTIALLGCEDLIVIHTPEATLVMPRAKAEELKTLHGLLGEEMK